MAISPETGTAEDHKKYDYEVLPAGTTFPVRVDLLVPATDSNEKSLLEALATALDAFSDGEGSFGAKRSRGLGRVSASWTAKRFPLDSDKGWVDWVLSDHKPPIPSNAALMDVRSALQKAAPNDWTQVELVGDRRERVVIDLDLKVKHDILVGSPGTEPGAPDVSHLSSGGKPILPGTSLAGVMRAQALRIAELVHNGKGDAKRWVDQVFGRRFKGLRPPPNFQMCASHLRVGEAQLIDSKPQRQTRVVIDRFTQGAVDGALFDEQTEVGGECKVRLELRSSEPGELGLVLLVVKDLLDGMLPVGGTSSVGRGVLTGKATVEFHDGERRKPWTTELKPGKAPTDDAADKIDKAITAFCDAEPPMDPTANDPRSNVAGDAG